MRKYILTVLSVLFVLSACMKENLEPSTNGGNLKEFTAKFESNASKTTLDGYDVYWSKGDAIAVFAPDGTKAKFTIDEQSIDGQSARFVGTIKDAAEYVAVYPYSAADSYDGSRITFTTLTAFMAFALSLMPSRCCIIAILCGMVTLNPCNSGCSSSMRGSSSVLSISNGIYCASMPSSANLLLKNAGLADCAKG